MTSHKNTSRLSSFRNAFTGLATFFGDEPNARIHLILGLLATACGIFFGISQIEWLFVLVAITGVFATEILNTSLENLSNAVTTDFNPLVKKAKDLAAAAVLIVSLAAFIVGAIIFVPKLIEIAN